MKSLTRFPHLRQRKLLVELNFSEVPMQTIAYAKATGLWHRLFYAVFFSPQQELGTRAASPPTTLDFCKPEGRVIRFRCDGVTSAAFIQEDL